MKKRILSLLLAAAALALSACGTPSDPAASAESTSGLQHIRIGYSPGLCHAPLHVAYELGLYEAEGLDAEMIQIDASHIQEIVGADQVDAGFGLIGKFLQPIENGLAIKMTSGMHTGCVKIVAPKDSGIALVSDLKGKRIGVTGLAGSETIITKRALADAGISFDEKAPEVEFVVFSAADLGQALENGSIDVIAATDPNVSQFADQYDLVTILDTATDPAYQNEYCCASFVSAKLAAERPEAAAAFTRAVLKASAWVNENPREAAQIQLDKKYVSGELEFNAKLLSSYNYKPSVQGGYDAVLQSVQQLADIGILKADTDAQAFTDNCYAFFDGVPDTYSADEIGIDSGSEGETSSASAPSADPASIPASGGGDDCCSGGGMDKQTAEPAVSKA
ncbi:MAG: ABC transporter substrate-binding protein [Butyricicoccus sp.]